MYNNYPGYYSQYPYNQYNHIMTQPQYGINNNHNINNFPNNIIPAINPYYNTIHHQNYNGTFIPFISYSSTAQIPLVTDDNSIINYILKQFKLEFDAEGYLVEDIGNEDEEKYARVFINNKSININKDFADNNKNIIYFNIFRNYTIAKYLLERLLDKNNINYILTMYILNDRLYLKDFDGNIVKVSDEFKNNNTLCYLDMFFKILTIEVNLKRWDVEDNEI